MPLHDLAMRVVHGDLNPTARQCRGDPVGRPWFRWQDAAMGTTGGTVAL